MVKCKERGNQGQLALAWHNSQFSVLLLLSDITENLHTSLVQNPSPDCLLTWCGA